MPKPGFSLSYGRYAYVNFNPIAYSDPTGHMDYGGDSYDPYYSGPTYITPVLTSTMGKVTHTRNSKESQTEIRKYAEDDFRAGIMDKSVEIYDEGTGTTSNYNVLDAYLNSGMNRFMFAVTLLHPEFYSITGIDERLASYYEIIPHMVGTGFQIWRADPTNNSQAGSVLAELVCWLSQLESPREYIGNYARGVSNTMYLNGEIPLAASAIRYALSEINLADTSFNLTEYAYWGNASQFVAKYGQLPENYISWGSGDGTWYAITLGEDKRLWAEKYKK